MARKDRHSLLVGRSAAGSLFLRNDAHKGIAAIKSSQPAVRVAKSEVRPEFFLNPWGEDRKLMGTTRWFGKNPEVTDSFVKGLILAQNERWRRGLGMQVERAW